MAGLNLQKFGERNGWDLLRVQNIPRPTTWDGAKIYKNNGDTVDGRNPAPPGMYKTQ